MNKMLICDYLLLCVVVGFCLRNEGYFLDKTFNENMRLYGQAIKRTWWMPWQLEAMKDVVGYEKPRGAVKQALIRGCPNGETHSIYRVSISEFIGY